ncbi:hypothetical protein B0J11DRAFT_604602 [Dendryphion nanum]|uniref:BTB domain-containing protein n=1 Tax=Dendryphion nanum TaxID=256645 RepID=A0A9P9DVY7_9PLEO|nr:hypothetical protein B0J11DRAFT_604602 [Dendryphion nanum]
MAPSFEEILQSGQFTFLIGEAQTPIIVHAAAIAATSKKMDRLINGHMTEAKTRCASFKDIEVADFARFCEYAYRGDYVVRDSGSNRSSEEDTTPESERRSRGGGHHAAGIDTISTTNPYLYQTDTWHSPPTPTPSAFSPTTNIFNQPVDLSSPVPLHPHNTFSQPAFRTSFGSPVFHYGLPNTNSSNFTTNSTINPNGGAPSSRRPRPHPHPHPHPTSGIAWTEQPKLSKADLRASLQSRNYLSTMTSTPSSNSNAILPTPGPTPSSSSTNRSFFNTTPAPAPPPSAPPNIPPSTPQSPHLLPHARLYIFARIHLIPPLQSLTLHKLHQSLLSLSLSLTLSPDRAADIIQLVRYVYGSEDLADRDDEGGLDDMKRLVTEFVVCEIEAVGASKGFGDLLEEGGEFVGDFWGLVRRFCL